jgi:transposase-like protein
VREIPGLLAEQHGTAARQESISSVNDAAMAKVTAW